MRFKTSNDLFVDTMRCSGSHQPAVERSARSRPESNSTYGRCKHCKEVRPLKPNGRLVGHDEPLRLVVRPWVTSAGSWAAYGKPWHPIELASIPTRIAGELARRQGTEIIMSFFGGANHHAVTDLLDEPVRRWLSAHLRFVEEWTGSRDLIDLIPASQAHLRPTSSPLIR